jgi:hypothetical protein
MNADYEDQVLGLMNQGLTVTTAWQKVLHPLPHAELVELLAPALAKSTKRRLRKRAISDTVCEQLSLLQTYDSVVHVTDDCYKSGQAATRAEHRAHLQWVLQNRRREVGIVERQAERLERESEQWADDMPLGDYLFGATKCAIGCGRPWLEDDPFELAHNDPDAFASEDTTVEWAHKSCNRSEGTR